LEDLTTDRILITNQETGWEYATHSSGKQDRDQCGAFVMTPMNLHIPQNVGNFFTIYTSQQRLCSMDSIDIIEFS
jgi:hypothetical protein